MKNILILVFSNLRHDARVSRQINFLKKNYKVTVVCFDAEDDPAVEFIKIKATKLTIFRKALSGAFLLSRFYMNGYRLIYDYSNLKKEFASRTFDLVIANDVETLPLAFELKGEGKVLFDAHEYAPRHFENNLMWRIFFKGMNNYLCQKYIPLAKGMTTVSSGLAEEYEKNFHVRPLILTNASRYYEVNISEPEKEKIKLIHHGIANRARNLELMIDMMELLDDRFTLDLMLMVPGSASANTRNYLQELKDKTANHSRVKIVPPVKSSEIVETINQYDVGVFLIPPINFNYAHTLPNKLFDFIQARLAIAIGPTPDMAAIIRRFDNGIIAEDFTPASLAKKLNSLTAEKILYYKRQSLIAAGEVNAEKNEILINELVEKILR
jgi:glycosyltransferase involved in cell wall biosynthesis